MILAAVVAAAESIAPPGARETGIDALLLDAARRSVRLWPEARADSDGPSATASVPRPPRGRCRLWPVIALAHGSSAR